MANFKNLFRSEWIAKENGFQDDTIKFADEFGKYLCDLQGGRPGYAALTTSQIRNFFGEVQRIHANVQKDGFLKHKTAFLLLKPKLAYAEARALAKSRESRLKDFRMIVDLAHDAVLQSEKLEFSFQRFVDFLEAILAYHKAYGGRD